MAFPEALLFVGETTQVGCRGLVLSLLAYAIERDPGLIDPDSEIGRALALLASRREEVGQPTSS